MLALLKTNTRFRDLRHKHKTAEQQLNNNLNEAQSEMRILEDVADGVQMQLGRLYKEKEKAERKQFLLADKLWKLEERS